MAFGDDDVLELDKRFRLILNEITIALGAAQTDLNLLASDVTTASERDDSVAGWPGKQLQEDLRLVRSAMAHARLTAKNLHDRRLPDPPRSTQHIVRKGEIQ